jgi:hypothetical protein
MVQSSAVKAKYSNLKKQSQFIDGEERRKVLLKKDLQQYTSCGTAKKQSQSKPIARLRHEFRVGGR